jgi:hypothetical protein
MPKRRLSHAELQLADLLKILGILGIAGRIAAFDVIDADLIQPLRDLQLVLQREADTFALGAVAESRVVDLDRTHGRVLGTATTGRGFGNKKSPETRWGLQGLLVVWLLPLAALSPKGFQ